MRLPDAAILIASSRLRPGLDGGYTVAVLQRAADLAAAGADVALLTFDPAPTDGVLDAFVAAGLATPATRYRNLFEEVRARPQLVREAALRPERRNARTGEARGTTVRDRDGAPLLQLPFVDAVDWHRSTADVLVLGADGRVLGAFDGFGALYRHWVDAVVAEARGRGARDAVVISESRSLGELLGPGPRDYALVHTVHNAHTGPPHTWDAPMDSLWSGWFDAAPSFDAVLWPTRAQRADAARRVGDGSTGAAAPPPPGWHVVPHPARPLPALPEPAARDPLRAVLIAGLRPQKRIEDALLAWSKVVEELPAARLDIFGEGPMRGPLERRVVELGLEEAVRLRGHNPAAADELPRAALLLLTSAFEGQSLVVLEALASGTPVVTYDMPYGPGEMVADGRSGRVVPSGEVAALAAALLGVLGRPGTIASMSRAAFDWARDHGPERSRAAAAVALRDALARHRRRRADH